MEIGKYKCMDYDMCYNKYVYWQMRRPVDDGWWRYHIENYYNYPCEETLSCNLRINLYGL